MQRIPFCAVRSIATLSVAAGAARRAKTTARGFEGQDEADPFGEKAGWDADPAYAKLRNVNVQALADGMESDAAQHKHFGPDWARMKTITAVGAQHMRSAPPEGGDSEERRVRLAHDGTEVTAMSPSAKWTAASLEKLPQSYEEFAAADEELEEEPEPVDVPASLRDSGPTRSTVLAETYGVTDDTPVPSQQRTDAAPPAPNETVAAADGNEQPVVESSLAPSADSADTADAARDEATAALLRDLHRGDPIDWETKDVVLFLRAFGDIDDDMASAFEMVRVDGRMLLNDVMPCDLFKEMRKWHKRGRCQQPNVPPILVQETIYLCYPYGK